MSEEEKQAIELDIEAKYVDRTEKEFLSNITYAECLFILTPKNKYCDKIRELSLLKLCEIIEKQQKENEELKFKEKSRIIGKYGDIEIHDLINRTLSNDYIPVQKVREKIEEMQKEYNKLDKQVDEYINDVNKDLAKYYENKEKISIMQTLSCFIDTLQELLEGRK